MTTAHVFRTLACLVGSLVLLAGCATERSKSVLVASTAAAQSNWQGPRSAISVGKFDNRSSYLTGVFSDGIDRIGN